MEPLNSWLNTLRSGLASILFPNICLSCGNRVLKKGQHICSFCLHKRFEIALSKSSTSSAGILLPQKVVLQQALWKFDKGGDLQNLLHYLKYQKLTDVGNQLGAFLAQNIQKHPKIRTILANSDPILVPVPLHYLKFRKRGFNQAFCIAKGIQDVLSIPICSTKDIVRTKNTLSQTGLSLEKRQENVKNVFRVKNDHSISGKVAVVVDDVFTTGATSFELANTILDAGASSAMIWTIAQA